MRRLKVDPAAPDPAVIAEAASVLRAGGLVAFPTETVYGLGADALDPGAVRRIYEAKGRPAFNPIIVHVAGIEQAQRLARHWSAQASMLARHFWPGPLTLVVPKSADVPDVVTAGLDAVGIRVPAHPVALALIRAADLPVAAPSANRFTQLSPTTAGHVARAIGDRIDLLLDGGPASVGIESTVVDLTGPRPRLLRPGMVSVSALESVLESLDWNAAEPQGDTPRLSPGQVERHYAPRARLELLTREQVEARVDLATAACGAIVYSEVRVPPNCRVVRLPDQPDGYARGVYAALHQLDDAGCERILVELPPEQPEWTAVHDRLRRAAR